MRLEIIHHGRTLPIHSHNEQRFAEAPPEGDYIVRLTNNSPNRRLAVITVDGINVIDGKPGDVNGAGYVLSPWQSLDIPGWRRSDSEVASFRFTAIDGSYSAQTGRGTDNVGVIGAAVFDEYVRPVTYRPRGPIDAQWSLGDELLRSAGPATAGLGPDFGTRGATKGIEAPSGKERSIGTGYGDRTTMHTTTTTFRKATSTPALVMSLRYATREQLVAWGIPLAPVGPEPFPASQAPHVAPPPGWRG